MSEILKNKIVYSFNAVTTSECIQNFKKVFTEKAKKEDIVRIHNNRAYHVSAVASPLDYPLVIVTNKYCFCLHSIEKSINADDVLKEF